jgi:exopolyphosphatase / guanosine-5'-triphosphate,3'-diphosphate pyrophosphatase
MEAQRVAVVDLGTNSIRLLVADVSDGQVTDLEKRSEVRRLGEGVDESGRLSDEAVARVLETVEGYRRAVDDLNAATVVGVATSAVRDAENGDEFRERLQERFGIPTRIISGDEEARLTFLGATSGRDDAETMVIDIGGGSTEFVVGEPGSDPRFHVSAALGAVRHTERHLASDPPAPHELQALRGDVRRAIDAEVPADVRGSVGEGIAVAGTATSLAAIDLELDPYDPDRVHGHELSLAAGERILAELAARSLAERRRVTGLDPDRAPTIVAGATILVEAMKAFGLDQIEVSEADLLHGAALTAAGQTSRSAGWTDG